MTRLFLGIDAGASKTLCLVGDAHAVLGRGMAGSANPNVAGLDGHTRAVREAAAAAFADAGLTACPVSRAWLGVAGSERSETAGIGSRPRPRRPSTRRTSACRMTRA